MPRKKKTWVVMADGARALIVTERDLAPGFDVIQSVADKEAQLESHLLGADRPGRTQESSYTARHALEPKHEPHEVRMTAFVRSLAQYLNKAGEEQRFDRLIIFAAPRALHELRLNLDPRVSAKIRAEVPKDLTRIPLDELPRHLAEVV